MDITKIVGAGVMVIAGAAMIAGTYQLATSTPEPPPIAPTATPAPEPRQPSVAEQARLLEAEAAIAELRRREMAERPQRDNSTRCVGNTLFRVDGDAWANVGRC